MPPRGWKSGREETVNVGVRLPASLVERVEQYYEHIQDERPYVRFTRGDAYREILAAGLDALQDKTAPPGPQPLITPAQVVAETPVMPLLREVPWDITEIDENRDLELQKSPAAPPPSPKPKRSPQKSTTRPAKGDSLPDKVLAYLEQYGESRGRYTVDILSEVLGAEIEKRRLRTTLQRLAGVVKNSKPRSIAVDGEPHVLVQVADTSNEYSLQPQETM